MGIGRLGFLGLTVLVLLVIGLAGFAQPVGMIVRGCAVLFYVFGIVPSRLLNAGMHRHLNVVMLLPALNLVLLAFLLFTPPNCFTKSEGSIEPV